MVMCSKSTFSIEYSCAPPIARQYAMHLLPRTIRKVRKTSESSHFRCKIGIQFEL